VLSPSPCLLGRHTPTTREVLERTPTTFNTLTLAGNWIGAGVNGSNGRQTKSERGTPDSTPES
jgi:hypothetical protein